MLPRIGLPSEAIPWKARPWFRGGRFPAGIAAILLLLPVAPQCIADTAAGTVTIDFEEFTMDECPRECGAWVSAIGDRYLARGLSITGEHFRLGWATSTPNLMIAANSIWSESPSPIELRFVCTNSTMENVVFGTTDYVAFSVYTPAIYKARAAISIYTTNAAEPERLLTEEIVSETGSEHWEGNEILQESGDLATGWRDLDLVRSPYVIEGRDSHRFYRLREP